MKNNIKSNTMRNNKHFDLLDYVPAVLLFCTFALIICKHFGL